jgi:hypothetical protein
LAHEHPYGNSKIQSVTGLESDLVALELRDAALGLVEATTVTTEAAATTTTEATTATATTTTTAAAATETTTATTAATTEATTLTGGTGSAEVQTDRAALELLTVEGTVGSLGLLNGAELDVAEALGAAGLGVSGKADAENAALLGEQVTDGILGCAEGKVADEKSVGLGASLVTVLAGASLGTVIATLGLGLALSSVVKVDGTTVEVGTLLGLVGLSGISSVGVLNVTESGRCS